MSTADRRLSIPLRPVFIPQLDKTEPPRIQAIIDKLQMNRHLEGGYFVETDRDPLRVPNPFRPTHSAQHESAHQDTDDATRNASTTIFYMLTPANPTGVFHRNKARTMHTLHMGRGCYIIIHADEVLEGQSARVETFLVGHDIQAGEKLQWLVEGGKYKASFLLPDSLDTGESQGLLISETVVPGFEFHDHDFMPATILRELVSVEQEDELRWMLSQTGSPRNSDEESSFM